MKLAFIGTNSLEGVEQDAQFAADHGIAGLEYNFWAPFQDLEADTVKKMRQILDRHGVSCSALGLWGWNHTSSDPDEKRVSLGHLDRAIMFAEMLGASVLVTGGGQVPDGSLADNVAAFVDTFPPYLAKAHDAGLQVALYAVHGNSFLDGIEAYERIWEHIPDVGIKLDPANLLHHGDDYLAILRDFGDRVTYVHIKEHLNMDGKLVSQPAAGMGDIQWGKVMAFLYEHAYNGYLSFEPHGPLWGKSPLRYKMILLSKKHLDQFLLW